MNTKEQMPQQQKQAKFSIKNIFEKDYENYEGVRRINIYVMRLFFALMFVFVAKDAWSVIISHKL